MSRGISVFPEYCVSSIGSVIIVWLANKSEEGFNIDIKKYSVNLWRADKEISEMKDRLSEELSPVLTKADIYNIGGKSNIAIRH
ncbi:MAG: hypothetical protein LBS61_01030 [Endomicrobium sp.]|jgi:hypothetical protein|nr:hypothetical protein [Endomicrobium sp.]